MKLICPKCKSQLNKVNKIYKCINNHSYDESKEGYVNLLINKSISGDNKEMVNARNDFLSKDYYLFLAESLNRIIPSNSLVLDCGCGEGYYTEHIKNSINLYATDISKIAITKAAKKNKDNDITYFVSSIYDIPVLDNSFDYILNICAPHYEKEFIRILKPNGKLIKVIPSKDHLIELKKVLYEDVYLNDEKVEINDLKKIEVISVKEKKKVINSDLKNLLMMTPYYYKTRQEAIEKLFNLETLEITFAFEIIIYEVTEC